MDSQSTPAPPFTQSSTGKVIDRNFTASEAISTYTGIIARWTDKDDRKLVELLKAHKTSNSGKATIFQKKVWQAAVAALKGSELLTESKPKNTLSCRNRYNVLKMNYRKITRLLGITEARWSNAVHRVTLPEAVWAELIQNNTVTTKDLVKVYYRPFPLYYELAALVDGITVQGKLPEITEDPPAVIFSRATQPIFNAHMEEMSEGSTDGDPIITDRSISPHRSPEEWHRVPYYTELLAALTKVIEVFVSAITLIAQAKGTGTPEESALAKVINLLQEIEEFSKVEFFKAIDFLGNDEKAEIFFSLCPDLGAIHI